MGRKEPLLKLQSLALPNPLLYATPTLIPSPALQQVLPCWRKEAFPSFLPTQPRPHGQCPPRGTLFSNYFLTYSNTFCASLFWLKK